MIASPLVLRFLSNREKNSNGARINDNSLLISVFFLNSKGSTLVRKMQQQQMCETQNFFLSPTVEHNIYIYIVSI